MRFNGMQLMTSVLMVWTPVAFANQNSVVQKEITMNHGKEFIDAVKKGDASRVRELLAVDVGLAEAIDDDGVSALLKAVYYGQREIAGILLSARHDLNVFEAAATGQIGRVEELIRKDPSLINSFS